MWAIDICAKTICVQWEKSSLSIRWLPIEQRRVREREKKNNIVDKNHNENLHFHLTCKLSIVYGRLFFT